MPGPTPQSKEELEQAAHDYGIAPGGRAMVLAELEAAEASIANGVYIVWRTSKTGEGSAGVRKEGQCCRVGPASRCFCGHKLSEHKQVKSGNPQAPACAMCKCRRFSYVPMRPEECGMWHLPRRKGFNVHAWRAPCKCKCGHDQHDPVTTKCTGCGNCRVFEPNYACIGCDGRGDQHETVFETESERVIASLPVGEAYRPLSESPYLMQQVLEGAKRTEFKGAKAGRAEPSAPQRTPEELLEAGTIDITEYRRLIALPPPPTSQRSVVAAQGETRLLGAGVGPTGREYAQAGATVKTMSLDVGGGQVEITTNLGRPMPQPGKDFSRPWVPAPPRRQPASTSARKQPLQAQVEDITPLSPHSSTGAQMEGAPADQGGDSWLANITGSLSNLFSGETSTVGGASSSRAPNHRQATGGSVKGPKKASSSMPSQKPSGGKLSIKDRLTSLSELLDAGLVTQREYDAKRAEILNDI
jgi:hypothetical protein